MAWQYEKIVQFLGKWAWKILIINGVIYLLLGIYGVIEYDPSAGNIGLIKFWYVVGAVFSLFLAFFVVKPKFSNKCKVKNWRFLLNYSLNLGFCKIPWMIIIGILACIFGMGWGGIPIIIPAFLLVVDGPTPSDMRIRPNNRRSYVRNNYNRRNNVNQRNVKQRKTNYNRSQRGKHRSNKSIKTKDSVFKPIGSNLTREDFKCIICFKLPNLSDQRGVVLCPTCHYPAHVDEFKQWTRSSSLCSRCEATLPQSFQLNPKVISTRNYLKMIDRFSKN